MRPLVLSLPAVTLSRRPPNETWTRDGVASDEMSESSTYGVILVLVLFVCSLVLYKESSSTDPVDLPVHDDAVVVR